MNDLSRIPTDRRCCDPVPPPVPCVLVPLLLSGLAVSLFILVVVRNALFLAFVLLLSALLLSFILWNVCNFRKNGAVHLFLDRIPVSDLRTADDGQIVKVTGFVSCGDLPLESSYEKVDRCIYTSTLLYEYRGFGLKQGNADNRCFHWNLAYLERFTADFYITDKISGTRVLVKAGYGSKIVPLIEEIVLINTSSRNRELSSTLTKWLEDRHLSAEARLLRLKEGCIKEGSSLTVVGMLSKKSGALTIVPPPEPISTGCLLQKFLLPIDVDGLVLKFDNRITSTSKFNFC